jgi:hypothetical protein
MGGKLRFLAVAFVVAMVPIAPAAMAGPLPSAPASSFPLGWYDSVERPERLVQFQQEGIDAVVPYNLDGRNPQSYLDKAFLSGVRVMLMIDRAWVMKPDLARVRSFVTRFKSHPALSGWHLVDEPTIGPDLVSAKNAREVYRTIRAADPDHKVAAVFGIYEDARPFVGAMDVMMFDAYPCVAKRPEFSGLPKWWQRIKNRAAIGRRVGEYIPVLQGFGEDDSGVHFLGKRLPTAAESRYMAFASIVAGADGLVYWTRYRTRMEWVRSVLNPLVTELRQLRPAFERGPIPGVTVAASSVTASLFRDPGDGSHILIAVHHGEGDVVAGLSVGSSILGERAVEVRNGLPRIADLATDVFGPYEVRVYRLV